MTDSDSPSPDELRVLARNAGLEKLFDTDPALIEAVWQRAHGRALRPREPFDLSDEPAHAYRIAEKGARE